MNTQITAAQHPARDLAGLIRSVLHAHIAEQPAMGRLAPTEDDANVAARWLVETELLGLRQFGVEMFVRELTRLRDAHANPAGSAGLASAPSLAAGSLDAATLPGQLALAVAARTAVERADQFGLAAVGIHNAGALGVLGCAVRSIATQGRIGLVLANSPAAVAPWGGSRAVVGTNPIALAVPRAGRAPLVLDYATSPLTIAALRQARQTGSTLASPGGFDDNGRATTDPRALAVIAPADRIASLTGLAVEMLVGVGIGTGQNAQPGTRSALVLALHPEAFGNSDAEELGAALARRWADAGGHTPQRFDLLPERAEQASTELAIDPDRLEALRSFAQSSEVRERNASDA